MSKVLVDPAALEEAAKWLEVHSSSSGSAEAFAAEALREAIAQPAETEGVGKWSELKKLAEKATPGPWWVDSHGHRVSTEDGMQTVFIAADKMGPATRHPETGNLSHWPNDWDASYIVNASPDKVLELIAALSAVTAERDGLAAARMAYANEFAPDENGDPDVGNVHANIRALKAERDSLLKHLSAAVRYIETGDMRSLNLTEARTAMSAKEA